MNITRDQLAAALEEFRLAVRTDAGRQESGAVAHPDEVADVLLATLSRLAAEFPEKFTTGRPGGGALDAVLKLADVWEASAAELDRDVVRAGKSHYASDHAQAITDHELAEALRECAEDLREAITRELTGEGAGNG